LRISLQTIFLVSTLLFILNSVEIAFAQIMIYPHQRTAIPNQSQISSARKEQESLILPFWDDFSNPTIVNGYKFPNEVLWKYGRSTMVDDGIAINQPTINVASFDGLDSLGIAYNPNQPLITGLNDKLESQPIDLSETGLPVANRDFVYLSFYYQWQGNGEPPDKSDYLMVEFKDSTDQWIQALQIYNEGNFNRNRFYDTIIKVDRPTYFHDNFQFRFRNFGRQSGPDDNWNIDFVYLNKREDPNDSAFSEFALASDINYTINRYHALPYSQIVRQNDTSSVEFAVKNFWRGESSVSYHAFAEFTVYKDSIKSGPEPKLLLGSQGVKGISGALSPYERVKVISPFHLDFTDTLAFNPHTDSMIVDYSIQLYATNGTNDSNQDLHLGPFSQEVNDTASVKLVFKDYFAYDDGIAEYSAGLVQPGQLAAYAFDLNVFPDILVGFDVYFPPYGHTSNQIATFYIYHDADGKPGALYQTLNFRVDSLAENQFQKIRFNPSIEINENRFYIGWKQPIAGKLMIGLDKDNDSADKIFQNESGSFWDVSHNVSGSLMIRPVFGKGSSGPINGVEHHPLAISVFPNPNSGNFYVQGKYDHLRLLNISGNEISFQSDADDDGSFIRVEKGPGMYLLQITRGGVTETHKIIVFQ
jgi:hypothetical protein